MSPRPTPASRRHERGHICGPARTPRQARGDGRYRSSAGAARDDLQVRARDAHQRRDPRDDRTRGPHLCRIGGNARNADKRRSPGAADEPELPRRLAQCRDVTVSRVDELLAAEKARSVEERYLDGRVALFPDDRRDWAERLVLARDLAVMADRIAELDGLEPAAPVSPEAMPARVAVLVADLVEPPERPRLTSSTRAGRRWRSRRPGCARRRLRRVPRWQNSEGNAPAA